LIGGLCLRPALRALTSLREVSLRRPDGLCLRPALRALTSLREVSLRRKH
jgi:hypothetical protein